MGIRCKEGLTVCPRIHIHLIQEPITESGFWDGLKGSQRINLPAHSWSQREHVCNVETVPTAYEPAHAKRACLLPGDLLCVFPLPTKAAAQPPKAPLPTSGLPYPLNLLWPSVFPRTTHFLHVGQNDPQERDH